MKVDIGNWIVFHPQLNHHNFPMDATLEGATYQIVITTLVHSLPKWIFLIATLNQQMLNLDTKSFI
jgi:hypothetical protein